MVAILVMVAGYQRSGTTVLHTSFAKKNPTCSFNETPDGEAFVDKHLRPQSQLLPVADRVGGTVIVKPNKLFHHRTVEKIVEMYYKFEVRLIWTFRDPAETYLSNHTMRQKRGLEEQPVAEFIDKWNERNGNVIDALDRRVTPILLVNYNELTTHAAAFEAPISKFAGRPCGLRHDRPGLSDRGSLSPDVLSTIEAQTSATLNGLIERALDATAAAQRG
jgi:hypothetical protein